MKIKFNYKRTTIENVNEGDYIKSFNIKTNTIEPKRVKQTLRPIVETDNQLKIETKNGYIINSKKHPVLIYKNEEYRYINAEELRIGDLLLSTNNRLESVIKISNPNLDTQFYDLSVDENENFFAGYDTLYLGHNSSTAYYPFYHTEIEHIMVMGNNKGTENSRVRDVDHCIIFNKLFFERYKNDEDITLFFMNDVPDLQSYNGFYDEFKTKYEYYEKTIPKYKQKKISADKLFNRFLDERFLQAREYVLFADEFQHHSAFDIPVKTSNLCLEIEVPHYPMQENINIKRNIVFKNTEARKEYYELRKQTYFHQTNEKEANKLKQKMRTTYNFAYVDLNAEVDETNDWDYFDLNGYVNLSEIGVCILGGVNVGHCKNNKRLKIVSEYLVRLLEELIDYNDWDLPETEKAAKMRRTLGIGFSDVFHDLAINKTFYNTKEGRQHIADKIEICSYSMIKTSVELAKEKGKCQLFSDTKYSKGILPIDTYNKNVDELIDDVKLDWESLRKDVIEYGMRHSTLMANAPFGSSSQVSNSTPGIEPPRDIANTKKGVTKLVPDIKFKNYYTTTWGDDFNNIDYFKFVAVLQKFMDQTISTNQYVNLLKTSNGKVKKSTLIDETLSAMYYGLKTLYYLNIRSTNTKDGEDLEEETTSCDSGGCEV